MNNNTKILGKFEEKLRFKEYATSTIKTYSYYLGLFLESVNKPLSHLTKKDVYLFLDDCSGLHIITKNQIISSLKLFYKYVLEVKLDQVKTERPRKRNKLPRIIDWNKLEADFIKIDNIKHRAILELACRCALRVSEVCNLEIKDIDSSGMMILIRDSKGAKDRYVPMSDRLLKVLRYYCKVEKPKEYLFNGQFGGKYSVGSCQKIFKKYIDMNKSFHSCRHSGLTQMVNNGTNLSIVQDIAGHANSNTTKIYLHTSKEQLMSAAI